MNTDEANLRGAYLMLLQLSHGMTRTRVQTALATLRDAIAIETGMSSEMVQDVYEDLAKHLQ